MTKKNKFLLTSSSLVIAAAAACLAMALLPKHTFKLAGQTDIVWKHYSERMPTKSLGIKEYWVSCNDNEHQFTQPTEGTIQEATGWDTSGFAVDDDRYTYQCDHKVADSALPGTSVMSAMNEPGQGFTHVEGKAFTASGYQGLDVDISGYDYLNFGLCHNMSYLLLFGGGSCGSDIQEDAIAANNNLCLWQNIWYYITLERNAEGKWDAYVGRYREPKRSASGIKMGDQAKNATNLKDLLGVWTWETIGADDKIYCTDVWGAEKEHHFVGDSSKITAELTCSVCGATTYANPLSNIDFRTNRYGAKLLNVGGDDVSYWDNGYQGGNKLNPFGATSLAYCYYYWDLFTVALPRIDFTQFAEVSFKLGNSKATEATEPTGNPVGFRIGFDSANVQNFASTWDNAALTNGKLTFTATSEKVIAEISSFGFISSFKYEITDPDVIKGNKSVVLYVGSYLNSGSYSLLLSDLALVGLNEFEQATEANVTDASIKEIFLTKQVRRVEQQDDWKAPVGSASNEAGHAEYFKLGGRDFIHFSAHYDAATDANHFNYNSGWSEWRFNHSTTKLISVSFTYMYTDANTDTSDDGNGAVHTMAQWYDGSTYKARAMALIPDGKLHTMTVTGDSFTSTFFVMKLYHFTGDIYISNITYTGLSESNSYDASIKEFYTAKQVRRVEQEDVWRDTENPSANESGHADYVKVDGREAIHLSAHYASDAPEFAYNSGWSEWRFSHVTAQLSAVTFTYKYTDSNTDVSEDGGGHDVHTMCQWYGAAYQARDMDLVADGQWHTITVVGAIYDTNYFVMKIYHFTGDIYISNIIYEATVAAEESEITDASIKEFYTEKQVRRVEQQDDWKAPVGSASNEAGHADYYKVGNRDCIHLSAHYDAATDEDRFNYNSGWSEWRFQHQKAGLTSVTFTYKYTDTNTDTANDGGNGMVHTMCQWYGAAYQAREMTLVADGQWHTITVTGEAYDINFFVMKIYHFTGDIYISNIIYA